MTTAIARFMKDETGATAIEYALVVTLIALALVSTLVVLGESLADSFIPISSAL